MGRTKKQKDRKEQVKEKLRQRKKQSKKNKHRARLIVRNLPFATTEDNLREHFEKFGEIDEIKILKKEDGKLLGCAFVQFTLVQKAAKARHHLNGKPFLNREIECDWAVAKSKYKNQSKIENEVQPVKIKEEPADDSYEKVIKIEINQNTKEEGIKEENVVETGHADENDKSGEEGEVEDEDTEEEKDKYEECEEEEQSEQNSEKDMDEENELQQSKPRVMSNDANEGRTVFIKNVPFSATDEDVKECMKQFGPLYYGLVCIDRLTEHSKGTAFVKFRNKEDAEKCLSALGVTLMGNILDCQRALTKDELQGKSNQKKDKSGKQKDSRNLYLVKEGVVLAGTKAAEGVSASDMAKRLQVEQYKTQMLRNLNMIVARTRLIVHNVPESWDDSKLRALFKKYSGPNAVIKEARIMRNMRLVDGRGVGKSKEYAFVTFTTHDAALQALRAINNNPAIFSASKRPIISFSIENKAKLRAKEKRLRNSQLKNPKCKKFDSNLAKSKERSEKHRGIQPTEAQIEENVNEFSGVTATPGVKKMRSKFNLRNQARIHHENLKKEKKKKKFAKKTLHEKRQEFTKLPRQKINKKKLQISDGFSKLVNDYKQKLLSASAVAQKKKWYE